jgi:hypothetical protein
MLITQPYHYPNLIENEPVDFLLNNFMLESQVGWIKVIGHWSIVNNH